MTCLGIRLDCKQYSLAEVEVELGKLRNAQPHSQIEVNEATLSH